MWFFGTSAFNENITIVFFFCFCLLFRFIRRRQSRCRMPTRNSDKKDIRKVCQKPIFNVVAVALSTVKRIAAQNSCWSCKRYIDMEVLTTELQMQTITTKSTKTNFYPLQQKRLEVNTNMVWICCFCIEKLNHRWRPSGCTSSRIKEHLFTKRDQKEKYFRLK